MAIRTTLAEDLSTNVETFVTLKHILQYSVSTGRNLPLYIHFQRDCLIDGELKKVIQPQVVGVGELFDLDYLQMSHYYVQYPPKQLVMLYLH